MDLKTILVPLDGSVLAELALKPAVKLAREKDAKLVLLRAAEAHTEDYLAGVRARGLVDDVLVETSVWYGPPTEAITEAARYRNADLIVMSSHGRSGLGRLVLGSVAESVLRGTRTPILLIGAGNAPIETPYRPVAKEFSHV